MQSTDSAHTDLEAPAHGDPKAELIHFLEDAGFHWEGNILVRTGVGSVPIPAGPVSRRTLSFEKKRIARALARGRKVGIDAPISKETAVKVVKVKRAVAVATAAEHRRTEAIMTEVPAPGKHRGNRRAKHRA